MRNPHVGFVAAAYVTSVCTGKSQLTSAKITMRISKAGALNSKASSPTETQAISDPRPHSLSTLNPNPKPEAFDATSSLHWRAPVAGST